MTAPFLMVKDRDRDVAYGRPLAASGLSRRGLFTALSGGLGLTGCYSASHLPAPQNMSALVLQLSSPGSVDLNTTSEQAIDISHGSRVRPSTANVVLVDVIQDDPQADTSALRWAPGYPVYDEAESTATKVRVLVKFIVPAGVPVTGRARVLFALPADFVGPA